MSNCSSGCPTQDHGSYAECLQSKHLRVAYCGIGGGDATSQKKWDAELQAYRDARRQGIQPAGTKMHQIETAMKISEEMGKPYDAEKGINQFLKEE